MHQDKCHVSFSHISKERWDSIFGEKDYMVVTPKQKADIERVGGAKFKRKSPDTFQSTATRWV